MGNDRHRERSTASWATYGEVAAVERMDDERFVADVDDSADSAARAEGSHRAGIILHRSVIVAVLDLL